MIIEMVGAPGSGKTTMVPAVEEGCRARGLEPLTVDRAARLFAARTLPGRVVTRVGPLQLQRPALWFVYRMATAWHSARFALKHAGLTRYVVESQRGRPPEADARRRKVTYWYLRMMGTYDFLQSGSRPHEAIVIDEGFAHRGVQLHASAIETPSQAQVARYLAQIPVPDLVIHVSASPMVCHDRVQRRGVWARLGHRSPVEIVQFVHHAHETVNLLRAEMGRQGWPLIDIQNDQEDPAEALASTRDAVAESRVGFPPTHPYRVR